MFKADNLADEVHAIFDWDMTTWRSTIDFGTLNYWPDPDDDPDVVRGAMQNLIKWDFQAGRN